MDGEISPEEVARLVASDDPPLIVDVRSPGAFARGHVPGSENVPFPQLTARVGEFAGADHIVTVCPHGQASVQAARLIASSEVTAGARVESMAGGLEAWPGDLATDGGGAEPAGGGDDDRGPADAPF